MSTLMKCALAAVAVSVAIQPQPTAGQPNNALAIDPRHHFDRRCPAAVLLDPSTEQRDPTSTSSYLATQMPKGSTVNDCAELCCHDWSCESFAFFAAVAPSPPPPPAITLTGRWINHDSLRGTSLVDITQSGASLTAASLQPRDAHWGAAAGVVDLGTRSGFLDFDKSPVNNRTFTASADLNTLYFARIPGQDPVGFSQNFTRTTAGPVSGCESNELPCCVFKDDIDPLVPGTTGVITGRRAKLPAVNPPFPNSTAAVATLETKMYIGINGDEFPITWGKDGAQYTGAGDNHQVNKTGSPLSFFKVEGGPTEMGCDHPPTHGNQPAPTCKNIQMQGPPVPVNNSLAQQACPAWHDGIPNLKSSGVLSVDGVLYWAISCFNLESVKWDLGNESIAHAADAQHTVADGDDAVFNRQRYGPAWIITSTDGGITFNLNATPTDMFPGRLAAPRFVQYGQDYAGAPSDWVYVYFPGTTGDSAFFENNDEILLARVDKTQILNQTAYQFFNGVMLDGTTAWTSDSTIATPIWSFPLMTSVQQVTYHPGLQRYLFANWAWISYDGYPRPDHTGDERNSRTGHQRTQLTLIESPQPWGPFSVMLREDDWHGADGSTGGYTPVIPPAWVGEDDFWIVFTQCCGNPRPPLNNYNFNAQRVTLKRV